MKINQNTIQYGHIFRIIHAEYLLLLNLINNQPDIDKTYLYAKDPYEGKYQHLITKCEKAGICHFSDPKAWCL